MKIHKIQELFLTIYILKIICKRMSCKNFTNTTPQLVKNCYNEMVKKLSISICSEMIKERKKQIGGTENE